MFGAGEWVWIVLVVIVLFGGKKIPELARGLGRGINEFKRAKNQIKDEIETDSEIEDKKNDSK
jgi:sec-independent protein translocase protein TatA|tara:strand:- start:3980 stop:4168 length:189 start_codon:yes stop_codon:yes gene_type:complete